MRPGGVRAAGRGRSAPAAVDHSRHAVAMPSAEPSPSPSSSTPLAVDQAACRSALESLRTGLGEVMEVMVQVRRHAAVQDRLNSGMLDAEQARQEWDDSQAAALTTLERADATHPAFHAAADDCPVMPEAG